MKKKLLKQSKIIISSVIDNVKNKKGKIEFEEKNEIKKNIESLRIKSYEIEREAEEITIKNENIKDMIEEKNNELKKENKELEIIEEEYNKIKELYELKKQKVKEKGVEVEQHQLEIKEGEEKIKENKKEKQKIRDEKAEIEKTVNNRLQESLLSNPNKLPQKIRKQILDLFFEENKRDRFEFVDDGIVKYKITDDRNLNFFITLNIKEEGVVIHTRQGLKGKLNLIAVTEGSKKHMHFVDGKTGKENEQINKLVKDIMMAIKEKEEA